MGKRERQFWGARAGQLARPDPGTVLGTISYLSPEQACGSADIDSRCGQFSFEIVLYELAAGQEPVRAVKRSGALPRKSLKTSDSSGRILVDAALIRFLDDDAPAVADSFAEDFVDLCRPVFADVVAKFCFDHAMRCFSALLLWW